MADDPFKFLREALDQFDAPPPNFDPTSFGLLGIPVTPIPPQALGKPESIASPEAGTRYTISQLSTAIEALETGSFDVESTPVETWMDMFGVEGPTTDVANLQGEFESLFVGTYLLWLSSVSQVLIESYTVRLLSERLVVAPHRNRPSTDRWLWQLAQPNREQLLRRCTGIDDELVDRMVTARKRRNELVLAFGWDEHSLEGPVGEPFEDGVGESFEDAVEDAVEDAGRYVAILDALGDELQETVGRGDSTGETNDSEE